MPAGVLKYCNFRFSVIRINYHRNHLEADRIVISSDKFEIEIKFSLLWVRSKSLPIHYMLAPPTKISACSPSAKFPPIILWLIKIRIRRCLHSNTFRENHGKSLDRLVCDMKRCRCYRFTTQLSNVCDFPLCYLWPPIIIGFVCQKQISQNSGSEKNTLRE